MALVPVALEPGVNTGYSSYSASKALGYTAERLVRGRYISSLNVRFFGGFAEKLGGWESVAVSGAIRGIARSARAWLGGDGKIRLAIGASNGLFVYYNGAILDVTPFVYLGLSGGTINFAVVHNTANVTITDGSPVQVNEWIFVNMGTAVGGIQINGYVQVNAIGSGTYTVTAPTTASSTTNANITATINTPRFTLGTNPITTVNTSSIVTIDLGIGYKPSVGDIIFITGATAVGGITLSGQYAVHTVALVGTTITVDAGTPANAGATGGGSSVVAELNASNGFAPSYLQPGWTLAPYGNLMSAGLIGGTVYFYDPVAGGRAYPVLNAPQGVLSHFVTPERFITALGTILAPLQMQWCDQQDPTVWTSLATNTANSGRTLIGGAYFLAGMPVADGVNILLTNRCAFLMQYTGDNEVYSTPRIADNAGGVSPWCITVIGQTAYWRGDRDFWMYNGSVSRMPSDDIKEDFFEGQNLTYLNKAIVGSNREFNEIWCFDVTLGGTEVDRHTIYQTDMQSWVSSTDDAVSPKPPLRTAWTDADLLAVPYALNAAGTLYMHESGVDADGAAMSTNLVTSFMDISNGEQTAAITGFLPDFAYIFGNVGVEIVTKYYPGDAGFADATLPPISGTGAAFNERLDYRSDGKLFAFQINSGTIGDDWRLGQVRLEVTAQGARK